MAFLAPYRSQILGIVRIAIGIIYWSHGARKMGLLGGTQVDFASLMGLAAFIEFFGGLAIIFGLYTSVVAFIISGETFFAYLLGHVTGGESISLWWWENRGEAAAIFAWFFLLLSALGGGAWSLDNRLGRGGVDD